MIRPLSYTVLTLAAAAVAAAALGYLVLAHYSKKATLAGTLVPASGAIRVVAMQPGLVRERRVREGERVSAGEELLRLVDARATEHDGPVGAATGGADLPRDSSCRAAGARPRARRAPRWAWDLQEPWVALRIARGPAAPASSNSSAGSGWVEPRSRS